MAEEMNILVNLAEGDDTYSARAMRVSGTGP